MACDGVCYQITGDCFYRTNNLTEEKAGDCVKPAVKSINETYLVCGMVINNGNKSLKLEKNLKKFSNQRVPISKVHHIKF